jgi:hypothetical protein
LLLLLLLLLDDELDDVDVLECGSGDGWRGDRSFG